MADAATKFVASLTPEQRQKAVFAFDSSERLHWNFIPTDAFPRNGLTFKEMTEPQRALAHDLLKAGLSQRGYMTASAIMDLETILGDLERRQTAAGGRGEGMQRDPVRYFFSVFGTPSRRNPPGAGGSKATTSRCISTSSTARWSSSTPTFFGSNPAEVPDGPKKGTADSRRRGGLGARAADGARREAAREGGDQQRGARTRSSRRTSWTVAAVAARRGGRRR